MDFFKKFNFLSYFHSTNSVVYLECRQMSLLSTNRNANRQSVSKIAKNLNKSKKWKKVMFLIEKHDSWHVVCHENMLRRLLLPVLLPDFFKNNEFWNNVRQTVMFTVMSEKISLEKSFFCKKKCSFDKTEHN